MYVCGVCVPFGGGQSSTAHWFTPVQEERPTHHPHDNTRLACQYEHLYLSKSLGSQPPMHYPLSDVHNKQLDLQKNMHNKQNNKKSLMKYNVI